MSEQASEVTITFPDGKSRKVAAGTTGLEIAKSISPSLAKRTVAMSLDGALADLADPINKDAAIKFVSRTDPEALELIRHDAAHVMAEAVQSLWPGTQVTIGPVIENGFYYDFFRNEPFTPEDFPAIEKKMREIIARDTAFTKEVWSRDEAKRVIPPPVWQALGGDPGWSWICDMTPDQRPAFAAQFRDRYRELAEREQRQQRLPEDLRPAIVDGNRRSAASTVIDGVTFKPITVRENQ